MPSQIPTDPSQRRLGWPVRLSIFATVAATIATACAAAVAAPGRPASAASSKHRDCTSIVSLGAIRTASQLAAMQYIGREENPIGSPRRFRGDITWFEVGSDFQGDIPGSVCSYNDLDPTAPFHQFETGSVVAVGYGESKQNWLKYRSESKESEPNSQDIPESLAAEHAPESPLNLGYGSQAFLNTVNLVAGQDADPMTYPQLPTSYYLVTVLTKHHDILEVGFYNATEAATVSLVVNVLRSDPAF